MGASPAATEAAERAISRERRQTPWLRDWANAALNAALPLLTPRIAAQALRDAADEALTRDEPPVDDCIDWSEWLRARADHLDAKGDV